MKLKKTLGTFILFIALLSFSQAAFAEAAPITNWSLSYFPDSASYNCKNLVSSWGGADAAQLQTRVWCTAEITGSTYVTNINQISIDWSYEAWENGWNDVYLDVVYDGGSESFDLDEWGISSGSGTAVVDLNGYSGPLTVTLTASSGGGRSIDADIGIHYQ